MTARPISSTAPRPSTGPIECADGKWIAVAAIEDRFYRDLLARLALAGPEFDDQWDESRWSDRREKLATLFRTRTRAAWCERLEGTDACVSPVLDVEEAPRHPHMEARATFRGLPGRRTPAAAPRFSRTSPQSAAAEDPIGRDPRALLRDWGLREEQIERLARERAI
jgi:alpha-methylacyl-CoA racemase